MELRFLDLGMLSKAESGNYMIIGSIKSLRTHVDKKGKEMAFGTLQGPGGEIDLVFFSRTWENCKALAVVDAITAIKGSIDSARNPQKPSFVVSSIQDVNRLVRSAAKKAAEGPPSAVSEAASRETKASLKKVHIRLSALAADNGEVLSSLKDSMEGNPGTSPVYIHVPHSYPLGSASKETIIRTVTKINAELPTFIDTLEKSPAVADVWVY